ncbi:MAG: class I SAM-dependent methyltransferase [Bryobacteraceae bacterium]
MSTQPNTRSVARIAQNIARLPIRTARSIARRFDSNYALERQAKALSERISAQRLAQLQAIPGMCAERECRLVAHLAIMAPSGGEIVEIGAFKGRVTSWLVEAAQMRPDRATVTSIDPHSWGTRPAFEKTVTALGLAERGLRVHYADSRQLGRTWWRPIIFLWIDGSHEYDDVRQDIENFTPHVVRDGLIAFDDSAGGTFPDVERAIAEWESVSVAYKRIATLRNISVFRRVP